MKKLFQFLFFIFLFLLIKVSFVEARVLPRFQSTRVSAPSSSIGIYPQLRADRKGLLINFSNISGNVSYVLYYKTNDKDEGVSGSIEGSGSTETREILFGTCSSGVCRYHENINNMKLEVTYSTSSTKRLRRFRIRV